jgi:EamA domain-containing membrane protein RarD
MQNAEDYIETWGVVLAAIGVTLTDVETTLKIVSLLLAIAFTAYKFYVTVKKRKSK